LKINKLRSCFIFFH